MRSFFNAKGPAYRRLPGLIGLHRLMEFGLYRPRLFSDPLGTLLLSTRTLSPRWKLSSPTSTMQDW
ncbi:hypothetical protein L873DRAFT_1824548 [Choiromyces venosus 120613-1]|uniref:Uncharacterized protein n=1 Tax=Choiromyces venosus 120613-1 TaxID=1336337 RepID=A0A3N4J3D9_9PEZI|nr:hypothetical protein L873DRAFT_1824548 [Choiromyces venosus 120613-1]